jgi:hypothetical protein
MIDDLINMFSMHRVDLAVVAIALVGWGGIKLYKYIKGKKK